MSITAQQICDRALRLLGAVDPEETPTAQERADALYALNSMLDAWQAESLLIYEYVDVLKALVPGTGAYTIGSGGDINVARPVAIESAYLMDVTGVRYSLGPPISERRFKEIVASQTQSAFPYTFWYDTAYPLGTINLYPIPSQAIDLHLIAWQSLQQFAALSTALALPPGYQLALEMNLAVHMAPEFEKEAPGSVQAEARNSKSRIKTVNSRSFVPAESDAVFLSQKGGGRWDFNTGEYR